MNRRDFLKTTTLTSLAAASYGSLTRLLAQTPSAAAAAPAAFPTFPADPCLQVGLNAYSFAKELNTYLSNSGAAGSKSGGSGSSKSSSGSSKKSGGKKSGSTTSTHDKSAPDPGAPVGGVKGAGTKGTAAGMSLFQLIDFTADPKHRFDAVDLTGYYFPGYKSDAVGVPTDDFIKKVKRYAADREMPISGTGIGNTLTGVPFDREGRASGNFSRDRGGDPAALALEVERIKAWIEVAAKLGAPVLRIFAGLEPSYLIPWHVKPENREAAAKELAAWRAETFKRMVDAIHEFLPTARQNGVIVGIQNHGEFLRNADQCAELINAVGDRKNFGLILDTGYFTTPDPFIDIERMVPYAVNFQIKEYTRTCPDLFTDIDTRFVPMDLPRLMDILRRTGYKGVLPIETLPAAKLTPYDPFTEIPVFLNRVRAAIHASA